MSIALKLSTHFIHTLVSKFIFSLMKERTNRTKDISAILNFAIARASPAIKREGIAAISTQITGERDVNIEYPIQHQTMSIVSCLKLRPRNIGSSFSICTGILYCIFYVICRELYSSNFFFIFKVFYTK
jgi:hypothetical protein